MGRGTMQTLNRRIRGGYEHLLIFAGFSCLWLSLARLGLGLAFVLLSIFVDMLDGSVARASGNVLPSGMVVDHTTDRYAEFMYIFGLCYGGYAPFWLGFLCFFSMMMPSYIRAKIESSGAEVSCQGVGIAERKEKLTILLACMVLQFFMGSAVIYGLALITVISQASAVQRLYFAFGVSSRDESGNIA
jgi:phosphatidylglycerophosphate synthase